MLHPTDTIWGLAADVSSNQAKETILRLKKRPLDSPLILLVSSLEMLKMYVDDMHPRIENLLNLHQQPLTIIYPKSKNLPDYASSQDGSIAIRICNHALTKQIVNELNNPIFSTSANIHSEPFPSSFKSICASIKDNVDIIFNPQLDSKNIMTGEPSVIARFDSTSGELQFIR